MNRVMFSSASQHWSTPASLYDTLNEEFLFADDPCPFHGSEDGLERDWRSPAFINPPYDRTMAKWLRKVRSEARKGVTVVMLVPSRTDTRWWHEYVMKADEIRFLRGRLKFSGAPYNAPFPSAIVIFKVNEPGLGGK